MTGKAFGLSRMAADGPDMMCYHNPVFAAVLLVRHQFLRYRYFAALCCRQPARLQPLCDPRLGVPHAWDDLQSGNSAATFARRVQNDQLCRAPPQEDYML